MSETTKKVQLRGGFSDRRKIHQLNTEIQLTDFDERTRIGIVNLIREWFEKSLFRNMQEKFCEEFAKNVFCEYVDDNLRSDIHYQRNNFLKNYLYVPVMKGSYDDVLTIVEYVVGYFILWQEANKLYINWQDWIDYAEEVNCLFQMEFVGYRFIDNEITPISDNVEVDAISESLDIKFEGCKSHIKKALHLLSDRNTPDYKNSIKESVSAVESICKIITKSDNATLGKALNNLADNGIQMHEALRRAFSTLYGYTSDEGGIRHSEGLFESNVTFEEAKFMLVSCCTFVNYLIAEYGKINEKQRN